MSEHPERAVIKQIDELVDWQMSDSPAAKQEQSAAEAAAAATGWLSPNDVRFLEGIEQWSQAHERELEEWAAKAIRASTAALRRAYTQSMLVQWTAAVVQFVILVWGGVLPPLLWSRPPLMFSGVALVFGVFSVRQAINTRRQRAELANLGGGV